MEFEQVVKERRTIRKYKDEPVSHEIILKVIDMTRYAPSWKNTQIARFMVVENPEVKAALSSDECIVNFGFNAPIIKNAPALVLLTYVKSRSGFERDGSFSTPFGDRWEFFDCGIAAQNFCLAAKSLGLGTGIMGYVSEEAVKKVVDIPEGMGVSCMITIGYPDEEPKTPKRKDAEAIVSFIE